MTKKQYRSAMGKTVDMGALLLQNETVRAVGNMGVNARGDLVDSNNQIIDRKSNQVKRQYRRQTNVNNTPVATSSSSFKKQQAPVMEEFPDLPEDNDIVAQDIVSGTSAAPLTGLAAAIAKSRTIKQELEKPLTTKPTTIRKI